MLAGLRIGGNSQSRYAVNDFSPMCRNNQPDFLESANFPETIMLSLK